MPEPATNDEPTLVAGDLSTWLADFAPVLRGERDADVACDGCTACCRSSQFVLVGPDEHDARAHIPSRLLFAAPGGSPGDLVLGYDDQGRCPMLGEEGCSIYEHRPRACRTYDCRVFAAAGVLPDEPQKAAIAARASRWSFTYATADDRQRHGAVKATARDLARRVGPTISATEVAVRAVAIHAEVDGHDVA